MANHKSAKKRIRQNVVRQVRNNHVHSSTRGAIRKLKATTDQKVAQEMLPSVVSLIDHCAKASIFHKNKAANLKSRLTVFVNSLG